MAHLPLVSVITPTWKRRNCLIDQCIPSVQRQTYPNLEHIIVIDGPDEIGILGAMLHARLEASRSKFHHPIKFFELERHYGFWGNEAKRRALASYANGDLIAYLDDDDTYEPTHLETLEHHLNHPANNVINPGFAYARARTNWPEGPAFIGTDPPGHKGITNSTLMHRRELVNIANWRDGEPEDYHIAGACPDWDLVRRWVKAGVWWVFSMAVTVNMRPHSIGGMKDMWHEIEAR